MKQFIKEFSIHFMLIILIMVGTILIIQVFEPKDIKMIMNVATIIIGYIFSNFILKNPIIEAFISKQVEKIKSIKIKDPDK
jgi:hypothetical protein